MQDRFVDHGRVWLWPLLTFCGFILFTELVLLFPYTAGKRLAPAETIALFSGAITAAGLISIFQQFRQGNREAALRLDELHAAFNAPEMQGYRDLAWRYLRSLLIDHAAGDEPYRGARESGTFSRLDQFATWWVCSEGKPPHAPGAPRKGERRVDYDMKHVWALTAIITFYVRLENHFAVQGDRAPVGNAAFLQATGPFVWRYWEPDIMAFVRIAETKQFSNRDGKPVHPYFVAPLDNLQKRYDRATGWSGYSTSLERSTGTGGGKHPVSPIEAITPIL